jgi:hypothetical protein
MKSQQAEFVLQVRADCMRAREDIDRLRQEEEARGVHVRVHSNTEQAAERVDRMRVEQEARPMHLRVNVDESSVSRASRSVEAAQRRIANATDAIAKAEDRLRDSLTRGALAHSNTERAEAALNEERRRAAPNLAELERLEQRVAEARSKGEKASYTAEATLSTRRKIAAQDALKVAEAERVLSDAMVREEAAARKVLSSARGVESAQRRAAEATREFAESSADLSRELNTAGKDFESAFHVGHIADAFTSMAPMIGMLPLMATGLAEVAASMQELAGASLVLPGIFAGIGASLGTLLVGVEGVSEAWKTLGKEAASSGEDQREHAEQVRSANESLASATREQGEAERDRARAVRDSRQEMEDLNLQLRGGQIDTAQAILEAQKARRDLATGQHKDGLDYQEAQLRVLSADQRVAESIQNQNKLKTRAADSGDKLAQADDRVAQAHQRVAQAQEHVNDVNTKTSASTRAVNEAMAKLAPNAQDFVKTIFELSRSGPLKDLQTEDQQNLFAGMSTSIRTLVNADLPNLKTGMGSVATSLNTDFKQLFASLGSDSTKGILDRIFGDTSHAQTILKGAIDPLVSAMGVLTRAGADTLPRLATGFDKAADRFHAFIDGADKDGRLDGWINDGITGFTHLGDIFINIGQSISGITGALGGDGLLKGLDDVTKKLATFLNSTEGQHKLWEFFQEGRHEFQELKPIIENLGHILPVVFESAREATEAWLPILKEVTDMLAAHPALVKAVADSFLLWKGVLEPIGKVSKAIGDLSGLMKTFIQYVNGSKTAIAEQGTAATASATQTEAAATREVAAEERVAASALEADTAMGGTGAASRLGKLGAALGPLAGPLGLAAAGGLMIYSELDTQDQGGKQFQQDMAAAAAEQRAVHTRPDRQHVGSVRVAGGC